MSQEPVCFRIAPQEGDAVLLLCCSEKVLFVSETQRNPKRCVSEPLFVFLFHGVFQNNGTFLKPQSGSETHRLGFFCVSEEEEHQNGRVKEP